MGHLHRTLNALIAFSIASILLLSIGTYYQTIPAEPMLAEPIRLEEPTPEPPIVEAPLERTKPHLFEEPNRDVHIEVYEWGIEPAQIEVNRGERIRLSVTSRDRQHALAIRDGYRITLMIPADGHAETVFTAHELGEFAIRCALACGGESSWEGLLVVR